MKVIKVSVVFAMLFGVSLTFADRSEFIGATASKPASQWTDAMLTGNGNMGGLAFGDPYNETVIITHCKLYLPIGSREIVADAAGFMPEVKKAALEAGIDGPAVAHKMLLDKTKHKIVNTDPFHPAYFLKIKMKNNTVNDYRLTEDFETGEIVTRWSDSDGNWQRKFFISRADDVAVISIKGPKGKVNCDLAMEIKHDLINSSIESWRGFITANTVYKKGKGGYDSVIRIEAGNGTVKHTAKGASVSNADEIVLLMRVKQWRTPLPKDISEAWAYSPENPDFARGYKLNNISEMKNELSLLSVDYDKLLKPHAKLHGKLFGRVKFSLAGDEEDRLKTTEQLLAEAAENDQASLVLQERMYDACRYLMICSSGKRPSNLQGIWTGTWSPAWSGDYTLDSNLQLEVQSLMSCNMPELMESYFDLIESWLPDCRLNAKKFYGCRGAVSNARASNVCLLVHWGNWPGEQLTGCLGWLAHFFYDYYQYTGDTEFLKNRTVPLLKEVALFYEDLLKDTEDQNGKYRFYMSYSPEHRLWANSTFDIATAKSVYTYLIKSCEELSIEQDNIARWKQILSKMPPYLINSHGGLQEWSWPGAGEDYNQRHHSHFLPLYQFCEFDPEGTPELWKASRIAFEDKVLDWFEREHGSNSNHITHGMANQGQCAARLGRGDIVYEAFSRMATKQYLYPSFMMSYWPGKKGFGFDPVGTFPDVINNSLAFMWEKTLDILPALPEQWPEGSINGILLREQIKLNSLCWKESGEHIEMSLTSKIKQNITVRLPEYIKIESMEVISGTAKTEMIPNSDNSFKINLPHSEEVSLQIKNFIKI